MTSAFKSSLNGGLFLTNVQQKKQLRGQAESQTHLLSSLPSRGRVGTFQHIQPRLSLRVQPNRGGNS